MPHELRAFAVGGAYGAGTARATKLQQQAASWRGYRNPSEKEQMMCPSRLMTAPQSGLDVVELLNERLAVAIELQLRAKDAEWSDPRPAADGARELAKTLHDELDQSCDALAGRIQALGGRARGSSAQRSAPFWPLPRVRVGASGQEQLAALVAMVAPFAVALRDGVTALNEIGDDASATMLSSIDHSLDRWSRAVEAAGCAVPAAPATPAHHDGPALPEAALALYREAFTDAVEHGTNVQLATEAAWRAVRRVYELRRNGWVPRTCESW